MSSAPTDLVSANFFGGNWPMVTIALPVLNEANHLGACLDSIVTNDYPIERLQILIVDGGSTDRSIAIGAQWAARFPQIQIHHNPRRIQAAALNQAISLATGHFFIRMDAHARYAPDYIRQCVAWLYVTGAANVGGRQAPIGDQPFSAAVAIASKSLLGSGGASYRRDSIGWVDTVYLGAWRTSTLRDIGGFEEWPVNEDYELNYRLRLVGGRILLTDAVKSEYYPRNSLRSLAQQYFRYGFWKATMLEKHPRAVKPRQTLPVVMIAVVTASLVTAPYDRRTLLVVGLYFAAVIAWSAYAAWRHGLRRTMALPAIYVAMHWSWGLGFAIRVVSRARERFARAFGQPVDSWRH